MAHGRHRPAVFDGGPVRKVVIKMVTDLPEAAENLASIFIVFPVTEMFLSGSLIQRV